MMNDISNEQQKRLYTILESLVLGDMEETKEALKDEEGIALAELAVDSVNQLDGMLRGSV